ncbi:MAG: hypothetical protein ACI4SU_02750, partial [Anaerovoracaceae bacterium]
CDAFKKSIPQAKAIKLQILHGKEEAQHTKIQETAIREAVLQAYNDAKRTMHGIDSARREKAKNNIIKEMVDYFSMEKSGPPENAESFDKIHQSICLAWTKEFSGSSLGTYGKAQKIINMAFKYLYCYAYVDESLKVYFRFCHMPLDSFTLEWFKRNVAKNLNDFKSDKLMPWSKIENSASNEDTFTITENGKQKEYYTYDFYKNCIRKYIEDNHIKLTPLQLEFIIWPETQLILETENYLFTLDRNLNRNEIREMDLSSKLKKVKELIEKRINSPKK